MSDKMMRLPEFLQEVDQRMKKLSQENMKIFVYEMARKCPESKRESFLHLLEYCGEDGAKTESKERVYDKENQKLLSDIEEIKKRLAEIDDGERSLDSEYNEEWDEWYNCDVPEVLFMDPEKILLDINQAMELVHSCVDKEAYSAGCELAEIMSVLQISAQGDYMDFSGSDLSMDELEQNGLLEYDFKKFVKECLYLTYMGNKLSDRAEKLLCMMRNFGACNISLEEILQTGNRKLPEFDDFLMLWIEYLGRQKDSDAEKLLMEAMSMISNEEVLLKTARKFVDVHPTLYEQLLRKKTESGEDEKMFQIGKEAMEKISISLVIRSDIALLTAFYAARLKKKEEQEQCWVEAFRSNSTVMNYMRIRFGSREWERYRDEVTAIYEQEYRETADKNSNTEYFFDRQKRNRLSTNSYCMMLFWNGEYEKMFSVGMKKKEALGWSSTFIKQGLSLMLLDLYKGEEVFQSQGLDRMLNRIISECNFKGEEYDRGSNQTISSSDRETFWNIFKRWKQENQLQPEEVEIWMKRIDGLIERRVAAIMENNRRNYYGECAAYIAAIGEVKESMGILRAKAQIMESYKNKYSRRRAFHQELRAFGMIK
ncbi:MAG: hypothetical protein MR543_01715 [Robinsoniella sp.]|nr:hypothetical protein [Robinsoniella sp.]